jgi:hypothetical protein
MGGREEMALREGGGEGGLTYDGETGAARGVFELGGSGGDAGALNLVAKASEVHAEACGCFENQAIKPRGTAEHLAWSPRSGRLQTCAWDAR